MGTTSADRLRRAVATAVLAVGGVALAGCTSGGAANVDAALQRLVDTQFDRADRSAAVALIDGAEVRTAYVGADEDTVFEIASVSKVLTGELLAMAIERGEASLGDPVGEHLPLGDAPVAAATLGQLATHSSGLPRDTTDEALLADLDEAIVTGREPQEFTVDEVIALARQEPIVPSERAVYSNLGAALLGHALASAAGMDYPALLEERLFEPLGMDGASAPVTDAEIPSEYATGFTSTGEETEPWADAGWAPSSGVYATLDDLVALCRAVIDGPLRESAALEPVAPGPILREQIGYLWHIIDLDGRTLTGKDGLGGGFSSSLLIDRNTGQAVVVLVNEAPSVTRSDAIRFLEKLSEPSALGR